MKTDNYGRAFAFSLLGPPQRRNDFREYLLDPLLLDKNTYKNLRVPFRQSELHSVLYREADRIHNEDIDSDISFVVRIAARQDPRSHKLELPDRDSGFTVSLYDSDGRRFAKRSAVSGDNILSIGVPRAFNQWPGDWAIMVDDITGGYEDYDVALMGIVKGLHEWSSEDFRRLLADEDETNVLGTPYGEPADLADVRPQMNLRGRQGDTFHYRLGDGEICLEPDIAAVAFGPLVDSHAVRYLRLGDDLYLNLDGTIDGVIARGWFAEDTGEPMLQRISFANGRTLEAAEMRSRAVPTTPRRYVLILPVGSYIEGTEGDEELRGNDEANTFLSGPGDDLLYGGGGDNVYYYRRGWGHDTICTNGASPSTRAILRFHHDIFSRDVRLAREGDDVLFALVSGSVRVRGWYADERARLDNVAFADGEVWDARDVERMISGHPIGERESIQVAPGTVIPTFDAPPEIAAWRTTLLH